MLAVFLYNVAACQPGASAYFLVPVTSKPEPSLRLQFDYFNDSVRIWGTNLDVIPVGLKRAKLDNPKARLDYSFVTRTAAATMNANYALQRDTALGFQTKLAGRSYFNVLRTSFLAGEGSAPIFVNQTIRLGGFPAPATWPHGFAADIPKAGMYSVTYLPACSMPALPVFDRWNELDCSRGASDYGKSKMDSTTFTHAVDSLLWSDVSGGRADSVMFSAIEDWPRSSFLGRRFIKPTYGPTQNESYYLLMKQQFVKRNTGMPRHRENSPSLDDVSLYHLLDANISQWRPDDNYFYDKEVRLEEMDRLIKVLCKESPICTPFMSALLLEYHRKALRYLELYFEPGSARHKEIADESLHFISEYYMTWAAALDTSLTLRIAMYLNRFNWFPGSNEGAWYGFGFLSAVARTRQLSDLELKLWAQYLEVYDPKLRNPLPGGYNKEQIARLMNE
jgi:hypothetical protein